jgi:hypothetical protein
VCQVLHLQRCQHVYSFGQAAVEAAQAQTLLLLLLLLLQAAANSIPPCHCCCRCW